MADRTILLADPDRDCLAIYSLLLEHHGFRVLRTREPGEALRLAAEGEPELIVTELYLFHEGLPLASVLRAAPRVAGIPRIGLTAVPTFLGSVPGERDCDARLLKPCSPTRLLREVERVLDLAASSAAALR